MHSLYEATEVKISFVPMMKSFGLRESSPESTRGPKRMFVATPRVQATLV